MKGAIRKGLVITILFAIICGGLFLIVTQNFKEAGQKVLITYNICDIGGDGVDDGTGIFLTVFCVLTTFFPVFQRLTCRSCLLFQSPFANILTPPG
jgi:hypothetical protein